MAEGNGSNGNGVTWKWSVGVLLAGFVSVGGFAWMSTVDRVIQLERLTSEQGRSIAVVQTENATLKYQLQRIEDKLDRVLETRR
jgi:hypothetical protein